MTKTKPTSNKLSIDKEFFESIVAYNALTDDVYLASIIDIMQPSFFKNDDIRKVVDVVSAYYKKRNTVPNTTELKTHLTTDDQKKAFKNVVLSFKQLDSEYNKEELYENTEQFFKERAVYNAVLKTATDYSQDEADIDTSETLDLFEGACGISLVEDLGRDYFDEIDEHIVDLQKTFTYISTGYKWLDDKLNGGFLASGRALYVFSGTTNAGKSIVLGNMAANMVAQGKTVIIITLEMPETVYSKRISSQLSRIPMNSLKDETENLKDFVESYKVTNSGARLFVKEYPPKEITTNNIKAYIKKLMMKKKIKPDAIVVDYINLIQPELVTGNSYTDVKTVSEKLRALSYTFKCPVISATQLNRTAYDEINPGLESTGESMGLTHTADFQASVWSSESDKEVGIIHMGIQKSRFGQNFGTHAFKIDYETLAIDEVEEEYTDNSQVNEADSILSKLA